MKLLFITSIFTPSIRGEKDFQLHSYFQPYMEEVADNVEVIHINMLMEVEKYLADSREYTKLQLELKNFKIKNLPLGLLPSIDGKFNPIGHFNSLNLSISLSQVWESLFTFIYSPERQKLLYEIGKFREEGALQAKEGMLKLARLVSSIRKTIKQYLEIKKDLEKINALQDILETNDLNDIFYFTEQLLSKEIELCELQNQLEELIYSNPIFYKGKVELIRKLFKKNNDYSTIHISEYVIRVQNISRSKISYFKSIFRKLPINISLEGMLLSGSNSFTWNWNLGLHPAEYIRYFLDIFLTNQIIEMDNDNRRQKNRSLMLTDRENKRFYEEQIIKAQTLAKYTKQLLLNEDKMRKVKPTRILRLKLELIYKEEEVLLLRVLLLLQNLVVFI